MNETQNTLVKKCKKALIRQDFKAYFELLPEVDERHPSWVDLHFESISLLIDFEEFDQALEKAQSMAEKVNDPSWRFICEIEALHLKWQFHGRDAALADQIIAKCNSEVSHAEKHSKNYLHARGTIIRIRVNQITRGYWDANEKFRIVLDIENFIDHFHAIRNWEGVHHNTLRLIQFYLSDPFSDSIKAKDLALRFLEGHTFNKTPSQRAGIYDLLAELELTDCLNRNDLGTESFQVYTHKAIDLYNEVKNQYGIECLLVKQGKLFLEYGHEEGLEILAKVISMKVEYDRPHTCLNAYYALIEWFRKKGDIEKVEHYQHEITRIRESTRSFFTKELSSAQSGYDQHLSFRNLGALKDYQEANTVSGFVIRTKTAILQSYNLLSIGRDEEALKLIISSIKETAKLGMTVHLADLYLVAFRANWELRKPHFEDYIEKAISLYIKLGYPIKAANAVLDKLFHCVNYLSGKMDYESFKKYCTQGYKLADKLLESSGKWESRAARVNWYHSFSQFYRIVATYPIDQKSKNHCLQKSFRLLQDALECAKDWHLTLKEAEISVELGHAQMRNAYQEKNHGGFEVAFEYFYRALEVYSKTKIDLQLWQIYFGLAKCRHAQFALCHDFRNKTLTEAEEWYIKASKMRLTIANANLTASENFQLSIDFRSHQNRQDATFLPMSINFFLGVKKDLRRTLWVMELDKSLILSSQLSSETAKEVDLAHPALIIDMNNHDSQFMIKQDELLVQIYLDQHEMVMIGMHSQWEEPRQHIHYIGNTGFGLAIQTLFRTQGGMGELCDLNEIDQWLYFSYLIDILLEWSQPGDIIGFIPGGELHGVPLHSLKIDGVYLIERNPVYYAPSSAILSKLTSKSISTNENRSVTVFGNPEGDLKWAVEEANQISKYFNTKCFIEEKATKAELIKALKESEVIHLAGHGEFEGRGEANLLKLADQEVLKAAELFDMSFSNDLVVLSGCETGVQGIHAGDELLGLVTGFLYAGSKSVISALWRVDDKASQKLFNEFYRQIDSGKIKVIALQHAMKRLIVDKTTEHPYFWAAFTLNGACL